MDFGSNLVEFFVQASRASVQEKSKLSGDKKHRITNILGVKISKYDISSKIPTNFPTAMLVKSPQILPPGRSRLAESEFEGKKQIHHPDVKIREKPQELQI